MKIKQSFSPQQVLQLFCHSSDVDVLCKMTAVSAGSRRLALQSLFKRYDERAIEKQCRYMIQWAREPVYLKACGVNKLIPPLLTDYVAHFPLIIGAHQSMSLCLAHLCLAIYFFHAKENKSQIIQHFRRCRYYARNSKLLWLMVHIHLSRSTDFDFRNERTHYNAFDDVIFRLNPSMRNMNNSLLLVARSFIADELCYSSRQDEEYSLSIFLAESTPATADALRLAVEQTLRELDSKLGSSEQLLDSLNFLYRVDPSLHRKIMSDLYSRNDEYLTSRILLSPEIVNSHRPDSMTIIKFLKSDRSMSKLLANNFFNTKYFSNFLFQFIVTLLDEGTNVASIINHELDFHQLSQLLVNNRRTNLRRSHPHTTIISHIAQTKHWQVLQKILKQSYQAVSLDQFSPPQPRSTFRSWLEVSLCASFLFIYADELNDDQLYEHINSLALSANILSPDLKGYLNHHLTIACRFLKFFGQHFSDGLCVRLENLWSIQFQQTGDLNILYLYAQLSFRFKQEKIFEVLREAPRVLERRIRYEEFNGISTFIAQLGEVTSAEKQGILLNFLDIMDTSLDPHGFDRMVRVKKDSDPGYSCRHELHGGEIKFLMALQPATDAIRLARDSMVTMIVIFYQSTIGIDLSMVRQLPDFDFLKRVYVASQNNPINVACLDAREIEASVVGRDLEINTEDFLRQFEDYLERSVVSRAGANSKNKDFSI